ncbi:protein of unknown function [Pseudomonas mediterranea]
MHWAMYFSRSPFGQSAWAVSGSSRAKGATAANNVFRRMLGCSFGSMSCYQRCCGAFSSALWHKNPGFTLGAEQGLWEQSLLAVVARAGLKHCGRLLYLIASKLCSHRLQLERSDDRSSVLACRARVFSGTG